MSAVNIENSLDTLRAVQFYGIKEGQSRMVTFDAVVWLSNKFIAI